MIAKIKRLLVNRKYEPLLLSLLLMLFGDMFIPERYDDIINPFLIIQNIVVALIVFKREPKRLKIGLTVILIIISVLEMLYFFFQKEQLKILMFILFISYFFTISFKVYASIFKAKSVGLEMISAVFCGFIMMVTIGSFLFLMLELNHPNSFSNLGGIGERFSNIQYFSFITSLTIGYGDIVPLTAMARNTVILLGLTGNFYSVFVTGIVIGKFINNKK